MDEILNLIESVSEGFPSYFCIQNTNFLCYTVAEISLMKNMERKQKEQIQGNTNRRRLILNS